MKDYNKNKESSYLKYWDLKNFNRWAVSQKLPVNKFKWVKDISKFDESFRKSYNAESDKGYFVAVWYPKKLHNLHNDLPFLPERMKIEKSQKACS